MCCIIFYPHGTQLITPHPLGSGVIIQIYVPVKIQLEPLAA